MTIITSDLQEHLTQPNKNLSDAIRQSHAGMAHFAGTGPNGMTCRDCIHWNHTEHDYHSKSGKHGGQIKPASCHKYRKLTGNVGAKVPDDAKACRHFEANDTPPARYSR